MYHVDEVFGVTVDMIRDSSSFHSSRKSAVGAAVGDVVARSRVVAASKGSLGDLGLCDSL